MAGSSDRNLLFGILALQMDFITREQLVAGMQTWVLEKEVPLAEHLTRAGSLRPEDRKLLEPLVEAHIRRHGDDPQQSLASISSFDVLHIELADLHDQHVDASIAHIPAGKKPAKNADPYATVSVGAASSKGMRFRILRPHAEGGLGRVSVALDGELGREVALKEIKPERADDPNSRGRFTREAEITGGLEHPGIVPVYGLGAYPDGRPFYAMRFIRGKSLKEAIEKFHERFTSTGDNHPQAPGKTKKPSATEENLELRKLLQRLIDVCEAMDYAHSRGVLHRDLKPGNIMLGKYGETLVVDWGLAKPLGKGALEPNEHAATDSTVSVSSLPEAPLQPPTSGSEPTALGSALGTPAFMSPEQAQGRLDLLGPASDVFSLGAILYQILTGKPPYVAPTKDELLLKAQDADYPAPRLLRRGIAAPLEAICLKALAPLSANRYSSCRDLAADLERLLADEPVTAHRDTLSERLFRVNRRHRTAFQAVTAALVILALGLFVGLLTVNHFRDTAIQTAETNKNLAVNLQRKNEQIQETSKDNKNLADDLKSKNDALEVHKKELNTRLAANYFQHGIGEYQAGRPRTAIADLRRAIHYLSTDAPLRESYMQILSDRILQGGQTIASPLRTDQPVRHVAFSPDGRKVTTATLFGAQVWNSQTGAALDKPMRPEINCHVMALSSDGSNIATVDDNNSARIWNALTGAPVGEPLRHDGTVTGVAFSPDGTRVATASSDKTARIWNALTGAPVGEPLRHDGAVTGVAFSPDGTKVATASDNNTAQIWNAETSKLLGKPLHHSGKVKQVAFSPDGTKVATASSDCTARIWSAESGAPSGEPLLHDRQVTQVAFGPDGTRVATICEDGLARVWNARTGAIVGDLRRPQHLQFGDQRLAFSPDGTKVATANQDGDVQIWDTRTGKPQGEPLVFFDDSGSQIGWNLVLSPDGTKVATCSFADNTAQIWNAQTGAPLGEPLRHDDFVGKVVFSPDGSKVVTVSGSNARIWNAETGAPVGEPLRHDKFVFHAAFSPDGTKVATASKDKTARIWNAETGEQVGEPLHHDGIVGKVVFSPDGSKVATASADGVGRIWNTQTGTPTGEPLRHTGNLTGMAFSPDGTKVATASDKTARIWNAQTGMPLGEPLFHDGEVTHVAFSRDGITLNTATWDHTAWVWDARTGKPQGEPLRNFEIEGPEGSNVAHSLDGTKVAAISDEGTIRIWNAQTGTRLGKTLHVGGVSEFPSFFTSVDAVFSADGTNVATVSGHTVRFWSARTGAPIGMPLHHANIVRHLAFSPDGTKVATASVNTVRIWNVQTGAAVGMPWRHRSPVTNLAFSPDGMKIATTCNGTAHIWNTQTGAPMGEPLRHDRDAGVFTNEVQVAFSPDGTKVATASSDKTARIWNALTGAPVGEPLRHDGAVTDVAFSPDGTKVATASDKTARVWRTATGVQVGEPMQHALPVTHVAFCDDGTKVATKSLDRTASTWNAETGAPLEEPLPHFREELDVGLPFALSSDGINMVTVSNDNTARIWNAQTGVPLGEPLHHTSGIGMAVFSQDGTMMATASEDRAIRIWNAQTGKLLGEPSLVDAMVMAMTFCGKGIKVATAGEGVITNTIRIWSSQTGAPLRESVRIHTSVTVDPFVIHVAFSPDGTTVATADYENVVRIWDAESGTVLAKPMRHDFEVTLLTFSPDGTKVATASEDRAIRIWNSQTATILGEPLRHDSLILAVAFSPDGTKAATVSKNEVVRIWEVKTGAPLGDALRHDRLMDKIVFSADGMKLLCSGLDGTASWFVAQKLHLTEPEMATWLMAMTGERMTETGELQDLPHEEWLAERGKLENIKEWRDFFVAEEGRHKTFHAIEAKEASRAGRYYSAAFHLRWALKQEPGNEELKKRLAVAERNLKIEQQAAKMAAPKVEPTKGTQEESSKSSGTK